MKRVLYAAIILESAGGEILLMLRDNESAMTCPKHWSLIGGKVERDETPETTACRVLEQETGLKKDLSFWKRYDREHPLFTADQYIFTGKVTVLRDLLVLSGDVQFIKRSEIRYLNIGYGFDSLLEEYFLIHER